MQYEINGSKITVIRKEEPDGITILDGLLNSLIIKLSESKEKNDNAKTKEKK